MAEMNIVTTYAKGFLRCRHEAIAALLERFDKLTYI